MPRKSSFHFDFEDFAMGVIKARMSGQVDENDQERSAFDGR